VADETLTEGVCWKELMAGDVYEKLNTHEAKASLELSQEFQKFRAMESA
jgi:hypothetical protein